ARELNLESGQAVNFDFHLNFVTTQAELDGFKTVANQNFALAYPQTHWNADLRSVGQIFFVTGEGSSGWAANHAKWQLNPRGWLGDPNLDINDKPKFKSRMESFCRTCVANADSVPGMRGFIIWDLPGQQFLHGSCVYSNPSLAQELAPEMMEIAADLMAIL